MRVALKPKKCKSSFIVRDDTEREFLADLNTKANTSACDIIDKYLSLWDMRMIARAVLSAYIKERGMLVAAGEDSTTAYFMNSAISMAVLKSVLLDAGVDLEVNVLPRSEAQRKYEQLLNQQ